MHRLLMSLAAILTIAVTTAIAGPARADDDPVVVELFTSQGCSSCPPADALLGQLAMRDDVIALALHVDYWDYLGWADAFADPAFTERQRYYARAARRGSVYTPQMIVGGSDSVAGYRPDKVAELIRQHAARTEAMDLRILRSGDTLTIVCDGAMAGEMVVYLVTYDPMRTVDIRRGENAGRRVTYHNVVTSWDVIGRWDGEDAFTVTIPAPTSGKTVVLVQKAGPGPIIAAARVD